MDTLPPILLGLIGSLAAGTLTAVGAVPVLFGDVPSRETRDTLLCVAVVLMLAGMLVSMIFIGLDGAKGLFEYGAAPAAIVCFSVFLGLSEVAQINRRIPCERLHPRSEPPNPETLRRAWFFVLAVTVHNVPEGFASSIALTADGISGGLPLSIGIAVQNSAEGLAVAAVLLGEGYIKNRAWFISALTGLIEPVGGLLSAAMVNSSLYRAPWGTALAVGSLIYVASHEIVPKRHRSEHPNRVALGLAFGLVLMLFFGTRQR